jgi:hypothetical protein
VEGGYLRKTKVQTFRITFLKKKVARKSLDKGERVKATHRLAHEKSRSAFSVKDKGCRLSSLLVF